MSDANQGSYGSAGWNQGLPGNAQNPQWHQPNAGNRQWGNQSWTGLPFWHPAGLSRPAAIAFTVLGFIFWWPAGVALLVYMIGSGRMGCFGGRHRRTIDRQSGQDAGPWAGWTNWACRSPDRPASSTGNRAFDEYKAETLRRMEDDQKEFGAFLERLRFARDKAEFDQFMAERRAHPPVPPAAEHPAG